MKICFFLVVVGEDEDEDEDEDEEDHGGNSQVVFFF